jgi:hypothetical protein
MEAEEDANAASSRDTRCADTPRVSTTSVGTTNPREEMQ